MRYTRSQADRLAEELHALPAASPQRLFNKLEMVTYLSPQIIGLQERGHSIAAIAAQLTAGGFPIGEATLRTYLTRAKKKGRQRQKRSRGSRIVSRTVGRVTTREVN